MQESTSVRVYSVDCVLHLHYKVSYDLRLKNVVFSATLLLYVFSSLRHGGASNSCARHGLRDKIMFKTTIKVIMIPWEPLNNQEGNATFSSPERLIEESFEAEPYVRVEDEDRVWHRSEKSLLLAHIQQRIEKGGNNE